MHSRIEGKKIVVTLELALKRDELTGGYFVSEVDGPAGTHVIRWGPMPHSLADKFIRERGAHVARAFDVLLRQDDLLK